MVTQVLERVIKGKRYSLCTVCAREAGWFNDDEESPEQGKLF
jgi:hypothetical protein